MGKHTAAWKRHERATAEALGGVRVGNRGSATGDVVSDWAVVECKERAQLPQWLTGAVVQAERAAAGFTSPKLPLVVLHELGARRIDDLVVLRLGEFRAWFGNFRGDAVEGEG